MRPFTDMLVLAGGFGTRLISAIGDEMPKPLAPAGDRPFLHHLVESWRNQGVTRLIFLLHHRAKYIEDYLDGMKAAGELMGCDVVTITEPEPLGTGGAVVHAVRCLGLRDSFLVANADTWIGGGVRETSAAAGPAMSVIAVDNTERYGSVQIADGRVRSFLEKHGSGGRGWINAGLYYLPAELFCHQPAGAFSLERDVFPGLAAAGELRAVPLETDFIDIGIPADYHRFCAWVKNGRRTKL